MIPHAVMTDLIITISILVSFIGVLILMVAYKIKAGVDKFDQGDDDDLRYGDFDTSFLSDDVRLGSISGEKHQEPYDK